MDKKEIKRLLNSFEVPTPCSQNWDDMTGDDKIRLCSKCNLNVHNVSAMTDVEAAIVLKRRQTERVCVYAYQREDGSVITDNCPMRLRELRTKVKTAAAAAIITLCYAAILSAQTSGGIVDAAIYRVNDVQQYTNYSYDTARNTARVFTLIASFIVFFWPLAEEKKHRIKRLILETIALGCVPIGVHLVGTFLANNTGSLSGG